MPKFLLCTFKPGSWNALTLTSLGSRSWPYERTNSSHKPGPHPAPAPARLGFSIMLLQNDFTTVETANIAFFFGPTLGDIPRGWKDSEGRVAARLRIPTTRIRRGDCFSFYTMLSFSYQVPSSFHKLLKQERRKMFRLKKDERREKERTSFPQANRSSQTRLRQASAANCLLSPGACMQPFFYPVGSSLLWLGVGFPVQATGMILHHARQCAAWKHFSMVPLLKCCIRKSNPVRRKCKAQSESA